MFVIRVKNVFATFENHSAPYVPAKHGNDHKICIEIVTGRILISRENIRELSAVVNEILICHASDRAKISRLCVR